MQAIGGRIVAAVRRLAEFQRVAAVARRDDAEAGVLADQRPVVAVRQLLTLGIEQRNDRIEERPPEPQTLDFHGNHFARFRFEGEVVDVFVLHQAIDHAPELDRLGRLRVAVGLGLLDLWQVADVKRHHVRNARCSPQSHGVATGGERFGHSERCLRLVVVHPLDAFDFDARFVPKDGLGVVAESCAAERHLDLGAALRPWGTSWLNCGAAARDTGLAKAATATATTQVRTCMNRTAWLNIGPG